MASPVPDLMNEFEENDVLSQIWSNPDFQELADEASEFVDELLNAEDEELLNLVSGALDEARQFLNENPEFLEEFKNDLLSVIKNPQYDLVAFEVLKSIVVSLESGEHDEILDEVAQALQEHPEISEEVITAIAELASDEGFRAGVQEVFTVIENIVASGESKFFNYAAELWSHVFNDQSLNDVFADLLKD